VAGAFRRDAGASLLALAPFPVPAHRTERVPPTSGEGPIIEAECVPPTSGDGPRGGRATHLGRRTHYRGGGNAISGLVRPVSGGDRLGFGGSALLRAPERASETHLSPPRGSLGQRGRTNCWGSLW